MNLLIKVCYISVVLMIVNNGYCGNLPSAVSYQDESENLKQAIENDKFNAITINRNCSGIIGAPSVDIDLIFNELEANILLDKWTFVVFSETFFGNKPILNKDTVDGIVQKCNSFSIKHPRVLIHVNFLHKFDCMNRPKWLPAEGIDKADILSHRIVCADANFESERAKSSMFKYNEAIHNRISNYSLLIWNGTPITFYRKSTYCNEANDLLIKYEEESKKFETKDWLYEFGDFQDHIVAGLDEHHFKIANVLLSNCLFSTKICYDLNEMENLNANTKVLIINANEAPNIISWRNKINKKMLCIEADAYRQNPTLQLAQINESIGYPYYAYTFFNKDGRFLPRKYIHSLEDMLPFYVYLGRNGFEMFSEYEE